MKCPYNNFEDCILEKCPACNYEVVEKTVIRGRYPSWMGLNEALERGCAWEEKEKTYKFVSCKLAEDSVQPVLRDEHVVNNNLEIDMLMNHSIF